jgi:hypothetical protein
MAICRVAIASPYSTVGRRSLPAVVIAGLALGAGACASATVIPKPDGGEADTSASGGSGGGGAGGSGGKGGSGGTTATGACDPFTNSGCDGDKKCTALQIEKSLELACGSKGNGSVGDTCERVLENGAQTGDNCGDGLACFAIAGETDPTCRRICPTSGTANACPSGSACSLRVTGLTDTGFCQTTASCEPLDQSGCASDEGCYLVATGAQCAPKGGKSPGDTCSQANDCAPGSTCLLVGSSGLCASFCSTADGGTPECTGADTGGDICDPIPGVSENLGICRQQP